MVDMMDVDCSVLCDAEGRKVGSNRREDRKEWYGGGARGGSQSGGGDDVGAVYIWTNLHKRSGKKSSRTAAGTRAFALEIVSFVHVFFWVGAWGREDY